MPTHVALLRGINLGSVNRVAMPALRDVVSSLGHTEVATYLQSGNVVLTSDVADCRVLAGALEEAIATALGVRCPVVVRTRDQIAAVVEQNPFAEEPDGTRVHAVLLLDEPGPGAAAAVEAAQEKVRARGSADRATLVGLTVYLHTPNGLGRSELAAALTRPPTAGSAGPVGTARNWRTVSALHAMLQGRG